MPRSSQSLTNTLFTAEPAPSKRETGSETLSAVTEERRIPVVRFVTLTERMYLLSAFVIEGKKPSSAETSFPSSRLVDWSYE